MIVRRFATRQAMAQAASAHAADAIRRATAIARPGDLVCYMTGRVQGGIDWLRECEERARAATEAGAAVAGAPRTAAEGGA